MPTSLLGISKKAESEKQYRFANLFGLLTPSMLKETWRGIGKALQLAWTGSRPGSTKSS